MHLYFSRAQQDAILTWAKLLGAKNVPTWGELDRNRQDILARVGDPTEVFKSSSGAVFYLNDVARAISKVSLCATNARQ